MQIHKILRLFAFVFEISWAYSNSGEYEYSTEYSAVCRDLEEKALVITLYHGGAVRLE